MKVEFIGGPADGKVMVFPDSHGPINVATPRGISAAYRTVDAADDLREPFITTTYRFTGSIADDGTRRFSCNGIKARRGDQK